MNRKPILGILLGDGAGVGAEIIAKLAASGFYEEYCRPVVIGDVRIFERGADVCGLEIPMQVIGKAGPKGSGPSGSALWADTYKKRTGLPGHAEDCHRALPGRED